LTLYGPAVTRLLAVAEPNQLGPGEPQMAARELLNALTPATVVAPRAVADRDLALACCAALWLRLDFLDESHEISQSIDTPEGSFWHGVMHRREPDFMNARYWFRRVGRHKVYGPLAEAARQLVADEMLAAEHPERGQRKGIPTSKGARLGKEVHFLSDQREWDAVRFVDLCELAIDSSPPLYSFCKRVQQLEWEMMFAWCYEAAAK
jgi:hypothetical protein